MSEQTGALPRGNSNLTAVLGLGLLLLLPLLWWWLQQAPPPPPIDPVVLHKVADETSSALDFVERATDEVFDWEGYNHDNGCPGGPLDHILGCHGKDADKGKSEFNSNLANEVYHLVETAAKKVGTEGLKRAKRVPGQKAVREIIVDMGETIGTAGGKATRFMKIYFETAKEGSKKWIIRNAYPVKGLGG